jgi:4-hydroxymandelate oxidase
MAISRRGFVRSIAAAMAAGSALTTAEESKPAPAGTANSKSLPTSAQTPLVAITDYEQLAIQRLKPAAREYIIGGAGDEITLRWNREAYDRIQLKPRVLANLQKLNTRVSLFGTELPFPIFLCPTASHLLSHPKGEMETVHGANAARAFMTLSSFSNTPVEQVAPAAKLPLWFQLYVQPDRGFTREQVRRAEAAGCHALVVTVDTTVPGARNREARAGFSFAGLPLPHMPPAVSQSNDETNILAEVLSFNLTWKDINWLRSLTKMRVLIKGVLDPADAEIAVREKLDGLIVSNHGARNLDTAPATIDALPRITDVVRGAMPVLVDGGVRRGTDVLKAIALGATAVGIGRAYLYGLAVNGAQGVQQVVNILRTEFEMAMALTGRDSLKEIDRTVLWTAC